MTSTTRFCIDVADIEAARERLVGHIRRTPVVRKAALSEVFGAPIHLKYEHLQRTGSFKLRGALNLFMQLSEAERTAGVVAASAGNHAQGVAVAASEHGIRARIYMPEDATLSKIEATRHYGAEVVLEGANLSESLAAAQRYAAASGALLVHPFDDPRIVAGQGTIGLEILDDLPDLGTAIVPIGGGGLFAGIALAIKSHRPDVRLVGVQAQACASLPQSLAAGHPVEVAARPTMADGIAVKSPGELTLPILAELMDQLVVVDDDAIARATLWLMERAKQVVEGAGAASLAALQSGEIDPHGAPVVCLVSGGNVDSMGLIPVIRQGLTSVGRFVTLTTYLDDRPGELARLLNLLASLRTNVLSVHHRREAVELRVGETRVEVTLQTRNAEHVGEVLAALHDAGYRVGRELPDGTIGAPVS